MVLPLGCTMAWAHNQRSTFIARTYTHTNAHIKRTPRNEILDGCYFREKRRKPVSQSLSDAKKLMEEEKRSAVLIARIPVS